MKLMHDSAMLKVFSNMYSEEYFLEIWKPKLVCEIHDDGREIVANIGLEAKKEDVDLIVTENSIQIKVEKSSGPFYRRIALPTHVKSNKAVAKYDNGILHVEVPKCEV